MIRTTIATVELRDGILFVRIQEGARQSVELASEIIKACVAESGGRKRPVLVDARNTQPLDEDTRHFYMGRGFFEMFTANALVLEATPLAILRGNIYFRVARPGIPAKLFSDPEAAAAWIKDRIKDLVE